MEKTFEERYEDELLTDNTKVNYCEQCKDCINWGKSGTPWDNQYDKSCCEAYPYPKFKPNGVINNQTPCAYRKEM